ncbi:MAG: hypothetical protein OXI97_20550, partial [Acidimicrobiaceae bacterium]|nr:hypothetical protein [Acidimicrobiaceae bacterium]
MLSFETPQRRDPLLNLGDFGRRRETLYLRVQIGYAPYEQLGRLQRCSCRIPGGLGFGHGLRQQRHIGEFRSVAASHPVTFLFQFADCLPQPISRRHVNEILVVPSANCIELAACTFLGVDRLLQWPNGILALPADVLAPEA